VTIVVDVPLALSRTTVLDLRGHAIGLDNLAGASPAQASPSPNRAVPSMDSSVCDVTVWPPVVEVGVVAVSGHPGVHERTDWQDGQPQCAHVVEGAADEKTSHALAFQ
jgi:hypothetical protein